MRKSFCFCVTLLTVATLFAVARPSLDGRAAVADGGVMPEGYFARTVGYLPGDSVSVTNPASGQTVDVLILGAIDASDGVAILLSPEAANLLGIEKNSNTQVKITKRTGRLDESFFGNAILASSEEELAELTDFDDQDEKTGEIDFESENLQGKELPVAQENENPSDEIAKEEIAKIVSENKIPQEKTEIVENAENIENAENFSENPVNEKIALDALENAPIETSEKFDSDLEIANEKIEEKTEIARAELFADDEKMEKISSEFSAPNQSDEKNEEKIVLDDNLKPESKKIEKKFVDSEFTDEKSLEKIEKIAENEKIEEKKSDENLVKFVPDKIADEIASEKVLTEDKKTEEKIEVEPLVEPLKEENPKEINEIAKISDAEFPEKTKTEENLEVAENENADYSPIVLVPANLNPPEEEEKPQEEKPQVAKETAKIEVAEVPKVPEAPEISKVPEAPEKKVEEVKKTEIAPTQENLKNANQENASDDFEKFIVPSLQDLRGGSYYVQIATMGNRENLLGIVEKYGKNYPLALVPLVSKTAFQVMIGPVTSDEFGVIMERFRELGYTDLFLRKTR